MSGHVAESGLNFGGSGCRDLARVDLLAQFLGKLRNLHGIHPARHEKIGHVEVKFGGERLAGQAVGRHQAFADGMFAHHVGLEPGIGGDAVENGGRLVGRTARGKGLDQVRRAGKKPLDDGARVADIQPMVGCVVEDAVGHQLVGALLQRPFQEPVTDRLWRDAGHAPIPGRSFR